MSGGGSSGGGSGGDGGAAVKYRCPFSALITSSKDCSGNRRRRIRFSNGPCLGETEDDTGLFFIPMCDFAISTAVVVVGVP